MKFNHDIYDKLKVKKIFEAKEQQIIALQEQVKTLRCDKLGCHQKHDVLASVAEAIMAIPTCGMLTVLCAAYQEIAALRENKGRG